MLTAEEKQAIMTVVIDARNGNKDAQALIDNIRNSYNEEFFITLGKAL